MLLNVRNFGAAGDGRTLDTPALQRAINACPSEGGCVLVPAGRYRSATLRLRSNVHLRLEQGAVLEGSRDPADFQPNALQKRRRPAILLVERADNVLVSGPGAIDGGATEDLWLPEAKARKFRPSLVVCRNCRDLRLLDVTLRNSDSWTVHLHRCHDVLLRGLTIRANPRRINTDGIDPDGCRNVIISDCHIHTGDDCIVLKSVEGDPCENVVVTNCILQTTCTAIKLGTESRGDIRNVTVSNCVVRDSPGGIGLFNKDGGTFENILISNVFVASSGHLPLFIDMTPRYYRDPAPGRVRNVQLQNMIFRAPGRGYIEGLPGRPLENLVLRDITWNVTGPCQIAGLHKHTATSRTELDPAAENYLENPYHLIVAHVHGLRTSGIRVRGPDGGGMSDRGLLYLRDVRQARIDEADFIRTDGAPEPVRMVDCDDVVINART